MKPYDVENERKADFPIDQLFLDRWSPRSLKIGVTKEEMMSLFEAARWSPSSSNIQPWRFLYSLNGSESWNDFFGLLVEFNQLWVKNAGALIAVVSNDKREDKDSGDLKDNSLLSGFDTGAAWMSLALQARKMGLVAHGMAGLDYEKAKEVLEIPEGHTLRAMIAIGKQGEIEDIPERMQKNEKPGTERIKVEEFAFEGKFSYRINNH